MVSAIQLLSTRWVCILAVLVCLLVWYLFRTNGLDCPRNPHAIGAPNPKIGSNIVTVKSAIGELSTFCVRCTSLALEKEFGPKQKCEIIDQPKENWAISKNNPTPEALVPGWFLDWATYRQSFPIVKIDTDLHKAEIIIEEVTEFNPQHIYARYPIAPSLALRGLQFHSTFWRLNLTAPLFSRMGIYEVPYKYKELGEKWNSSQQARFSMHQPWYKIINHAMREDYSPEYKAKLPDDIFNHWKRVVDATAISKITADELDAKLKEGMPYTYDFGSTVPPLRSFFGKFKQHVQGRKGVVLGSIYPWLEFETLRAGAAHVTTLEYIDLKQVIPVGHSHMAHLHPKELEQIMATTGNVSYDFAMTYSSIEHAGLGRYSDPFNPDGDFMELAKLSCVVKPGGLLFLGIPVTGDCMVYSLHRFYGPIRYSMLTECWKVLEFESFSITNDCAPISPYQPWFVLQNLRGCAF